MSGGDKAPSKIQLGIAVSCAIALKNIEDGELPEWIAAHYCHGNGDAEIDRISKEFGIPDAAQNRLLASALGLHLSFSEPPPSRPKAVRRELDSLTNHLRKALRSISILEESNVEGFGPLLVDASVPRDGAEICSRRAFSALAPETANDTFLVVEGPAEAAHREIKHFLEYLDAIEHPQERAGQKTGLLAWAERGLNSLIEEYAPALSTSERTKLSEGLFNPVLEHHGHISRIDAELQPRARDRVKRAADGRPRATHSRKIGQKQN